MSIKGVIKLCSVSIIAHLSIFVKYLKRFNRKIKNKKTFDMNVPMKGGEIMRAIDILFDEIDKINSQIKIEDDTYARVVLAFEIGKIVEIIRGMEELKSRTFFPNTQYMLYPKDYI